MLKKIAAAAVLVFYAIPMGAAGATLPGAADTSALPPDGGETYNRLIFEKSPYLLLHAANPVDWYPWGEEAFAKARREGKPIFLSIGYSTCHWCHVMEEESFASEEIAAVINEHYVAIKVDREERPDIDRIYLIVSEILTGNSGWPLNVLLTPDRKPFYAMTYLPPETRGGRPGLSDVLVTAANEWRDNRDELTEAAERITAVLAKIGEGESGKEPGAEALDAAYTAIADRFDSLHGGFLPPPKFPRPHMYGFLLRYAARSGEDHAGKMVLRTLRALRRGGIYDQLGGGFHRYSTDREFLVPHFEKMLYDQALLAIAYLEAWQVSKDPFYADTAREVFHWVDAELTAEEGGFYSAVDADSEGEEGRYYVWAYDDITRVLGKKRGEALARIFNARPEGNYRDEATGEPQPRNILHLSSDPPDDREFNRGRQLLLEHRGTRVRPLRDDKILTGWNGLMIAALARGGALLGNQSYIEKAARSARFVLDRLRDDNGRLLRRFREGNAALPAYLDDYAFLVYGLIELYEAALDPAWLATAVQLNGEMIDVFGNEQDGALSFSGKGNEELVAGGSESYDGALPSGNSVAALNLLRLSRLTGDKGLEEKAGKIFSSFGNSIARSPAGHTMMLTALDFYLGPSKELVIVGRPGEQGVDRFLGVARSAFRPNTVVLLRPPGEQGNDVVRLAPYTKFMRLREGMATAYLCENFTCKDPVTDARALEQALR